MPPDPSSLFLKPTLIPHLNGRTSLSPALDGVSPLANGTSRRKKPFSASLCENTLFVIVHIASISTCD